MEEVASTFQPTSWAAAAFGRENDPPRMNNQQIDFTFNPDMLHGDIPRGDGRSNPFGSASTFTSFPSQPSSQQQQPPSSPFQWDMSDEEDEDDDEV